jgi:hypothetical protein
VDEADWSIQNLPDMLYERDAHGVVAWEDKYIIVVGAWHSVASLRKCEIFDIEQNHWRQLPDLNANTCAPGLIVMQRRYVYMIGGGANVLHIEKLDLCKPDHWTRINSNSGMGSRQTINRCLLYPISNNRIFILGCHFNKTEKPFVYLCDENRFEAYGKEKLNVDMYKSNDIVTSLDGKAIYVRPFLKVNQDVEEVKILQINIDSNQIPGEKNEFTAGPRGFFKRMLSKYKIRPIKRNKSLTSSKTNVKKKLKDFFKRRP